MKRHYESGKCVETQYGQNDGIGAYKQDRVSSKVTPGLSDMDFSKVAASMMFDYQNSMKKHYQSGKCADTQYEQNDNIDVCQQDRVSSKFTSEQSDMDYSKEAVSNMFDSKNHLTPPLVCHSSAADSETKEPLDLGLGSLITNSHQLTWYHQHESTWHKKQAIARNTQLGTSADIDSHTKCGISKYESADHGTATPHSPSDKLPELT